MEITCIIQKSAKKRILAYRLTTRRILTKKHRIKWVGDRFYGYRQTRKSNIRNIAKHCNKKPRLFQIQTSLEKQKTL